MRLFQSFRRHISAWLRLQTPSRYIGHQCRDQMSEKPGTGYLLIEYIDRPQGRMLSETWDEKRHDANL